MRWYEVDVKRLMILTAGAIGILAIFIALYSTLNFNRQMLIWAVSSEGILLLCILTLYFTQLSAAKKSNREKELEAQFFQAQKMEAVGRLAGGMAHDFNNILAAINGYAEFLTDDLDEGTPEHKFAMGILDSGHQARDLVDQIMTFSRVGTSEMVSADLQNILRETSRMLSATLPKNIEIQTRFEADNPWILGNVSQMTQTVMNLGVNANDALNEKGGSLIMGIENADIDYLKKLGLFEKCEDEEGGALIQIEELEDKTTELVLGQLEKDQEYISLYVRDTGCGMSKVVMERVFEPFFTTKDVEKGTGLGLATVHGVVLSHEGAVIIRSKVGEGTQFEVILPSHDRAENQDDQKLDTIIKGQGTVLVVDDQEHIRDVMMSALGRLGYEVEASASASDALDALRENPSKFDLVITDYNMPDMTGLELVQQASVDLPDMPFIILSGYGQEKMQRLMEQAKSIKAVLRKPVSKGVLSHKVSDILNG